jgi:hypothetical protein
MSDCKKAYEEKKKNNNLSKNLLTKFLVNTSVPTNPVYTPGLILLNFNPFNIPLRKLISDCFSILLLKTF